MEEIEDGSAAEMVGTDGDEEDTGRGGFEVVETVERRRGGVEGVLKDVPAPALALPSTKLLLLVLSSTVPSLLVLVVAMPVVIPCCASLSLLFVVELVLLLPIPMWSHQHTCACAT